MSTLLWHCWLGSRKGIRPVKNWVVGCWRGCLGWGAGLHMAQQMPLPLTISCASKSRLVLPFMVLPFWYLLTRAVPDKFQKSSKTIVCVNDMLYRKMLQLCQSVRSYSLPFPFYYSCLYSDSWNILGLLPFFLPFFSSSSSSEAVSTTTEPNNLLF